jgi:hypothetical protein
VSLFTREQLLAAAARIAAREAATNFVYQPRPKSAWLARVNQTRDGVPAPTTEPVSPAVAPDGGFVETRRPFICCKTCGHWRSHHCTARKQPREPRPVEPRACERCGYARTEEYWGRNCPKCRHWSKREWKAKLAAELKKEKAARRWFGFADEKGEVARCQHTPNDGADYRCSSTSCAEGDESTGQFCPCAKFINPLAKPRQSKSRRKQPETLAVV